jgi:site-specific DNA-cytosine methylase
MSKPVVIDLCCGLGGWSHGFIAEGWDAIGFDIERHEYGDKRYPGELILHDILDLNGYDLAAANPWAIAASPPCQEFSYMAMPFSRGKQIAAVLRGQGEFPKCYTLLPVG